MNARPEALHPNGAQMANWSGSLTFRPRFLESPQDEDDAAVIVRHAARRGLKVRPVGRLHSSSPIIATDDVCVSMENLSGVIEHDAEEGWALVGPGTPLDEMGRSLNDLGLATHNLGDINVQTVVGAVSTCTHGSGRKLTNLATMLIGGRKVTADGEVREIGTTSYMRPGLHGNAGDVHRPQASSAAPLPAAAESGAPPWTDDSGSSRTSVVAAGTLTCTGIPAATVSSFAPSTRRERVRTGSGAPSWSWAWKDGATRCCRARGT